MHFSSVRRDDSDYSQHHRAPTQGDLPSDHDRRPQETSMSEKTGKPHALRLRKLAEAWAQEAQQELELEADQIEEATRAFREALTERIAPQKKP
jgi:hypothetical protein